jgi:hypothetical protein
MAGHPQVLGFGCWPTTFFLEPNASPHINYHVARLLRSPSRPRQVLSRGGTAVRKGPYRQGPSRTATAGHTSKEDLWSTPEAILDYCCRGRAHHRRGNRRCCRRNTSQQVQVQRRYPKQSNLHRRPSHDRTYHLFRKRCNVGFAGSPDNVVNIPAKSLDDCINKCARYNEKNKTEIASRESNVCNSVCWRHRVTGDDWPGQCFGSTIQNSTSSGFPVDEDQIECDSGAWINQEIPGRDG